jgi:hypothetical protein
MRRCARAKKVREALAADGILAGGLAAHVATCSECAGIHVARRFQARLDAAMAELITDALPSSTAIVARTAPAVARRRSSPSTLLSAIASGALVAFALVGIFVTGASLRDTLDGRSGAGPMVSDQDLETVDCYLGDPSVHVDTTGLGNGNPGAAIAYCFGAVETERDDRAHAISCARSMDRQAQIRRAWETGETPEPDASRPTYLGACARVVDVEVRDVGPSEDGLTGKVPSVPLTSWDEADEVVEWPLLRPGWLPEGYELVVLQGFGPAINREVVDWVAATYLRAGNPLTIDQFVVTDPDAFRVELNISGDQLANVTTGQTTVASHGAFWADGVVATSGGPGQGVDALVLTWTDGEVGYRITSRSDDLDALRRMGESLTEG